VLTVPNGVDLALFSTARKKIPHPPTLAYMGSLAPSWGVDLSVRALPALKKRIPNVQLVIAGAGPEEAALKDLAAQLDVGREVRFLGQVQPSALPGILAGADVGLALSLPDSQFRQYASPLKLIEYMAAGLPVIATRVGQTALAMQEAKAGILIDQSVDEFVNAAEQLLTDARLGEACSTAAIAYVARFDWSIVLQHAYQCILDVLAD